MTKILLVEDDKSLREIYGVRLLAEGYDIVSAGDGEEALAMAIKERPALIVSDVMMPKISGFDMLDILRSTTETKDIKVIMMTALSSEDQRQRGEKLGADRYLVKSQVGIEDVVRTVHEVLGDIPGMAHATTPAPAAHSAQPTASTPQPQNLATNNAPSDQGQALPQPTAPFSSSVPRPANLGDRVLQPLPQAGPQNQNFSKMMEQELSGQQPQQQANTVQPQPAPAEVAPVNEPSEIARPDVASLSPQSPAPAPAPAQPAAAPQQSVPQAQMPQHPNLPPPPPTF